MKITRLGLDLAKNVIQMHAVNARNEVVIRKAFSRLKLMAFMQGLEPCLVGMEACAGAHHWARCFQAMGHRVVLIAPQHVKPYVLGRKNDANDAAGICEAMARPTIPQVAIKTQAQQDIQALHRIRSEVMKTRTAKVNQVRGLLAEYGVVIAQSIHQCRRTLPLILEDAENGLSVDFRTLLSDLYEDLVMLDQRLVQRHYRALAHSPPVRCSRYYPMPSRPRTSRMEDNLPPSSASRPNNIPVGVNNACLAFTNTAIVICGDCWYTVPGACSGWQ
jgi:transposase